VRVAAPNWSICASMRAKSNSRQRRPSTPPAWLAALLNRLPLGTEIALPSSPLRESLGQYSAMATPIHAFEAPSWRSAAIRSGRRLSSSPGDSVAAICGATGMTPASALCQMGAGRRAQHHIQRVHGRVQPRHEDRDGCPDLSQRAFDLAHLECAPLLYRRLTVASSSCCVCTCRWRSRQVMHNGVGDRPFRNNRLEIARVDSDMSDHNGQKYASMLSSSPCTPSIRMVRCLLAAFTSPRSSRSSRSDQSCIIFRRGSTYKAWL